MTAADATVDEPVTVEVPSHEPKETEGFLLVDTVATAATVPAEDSTPTVGNTATEDSPMEPSSSIEPSSSSSSSEPSASATTETEQEEEKDDKEEEQGVPEQRVPVDIASQRRMEQEQEINTATKEVIEPMKMLRKGATAVIGGTMVGVGLVMIPLPTPMGCVVASSGMAILGSEFEGAKEMNDRLKEKSKEHLTSARDKAIAHIESMNSNDDTDDDSVNGAEEEAPAWLKNCNEAERKRQLKLMKQKYREETLSTDERLKMYVKKGTGSFLSRNILPVLNKTKNWGKEEEGTPGEALEGAHENAEHTTSSPTAASEAPSPSEALQKGKEKMSEALNATSATFSSWVKRMSPQAAADDEKKMEFDEEINFDENAASEEKDAAFNDDIAGAPVAITPVVATTDTISAAPEPVPGASVVAI